MPSVSHSLHGLPPNWGTKTAGDGKMYYYNCVTDDTVWSLEGIDKETGELQQKNSRSPPANAEGLAVSMERSPSGFIGDPDASSPGTITWTKLTANVILYIHDLNHSAKRKQKANYISQSACIVEAIRVMLYASGTVEKDAPSVKGHKILRVYHRNIMSALSKLVISAKVASGVWPPPDADQRLQADANEVLFAIRHFVSAAQDAGVNVHSVDPESLSAGATASTKSFPLSSTSITPTTDVQLPRRISSIPNGATAVETALVSGPPAPRISATRRSSNVPRQLESSSISPATRSRRPAASGNPPDLITQLDQSSRSIFNATNQLSKNIQGKTAHVRQKSSGSDVLIQTDARSAQTLIGETRATVTEVGQFLSLVEDLRPDLSSPDLNGKNLTWQADEFLLAKQALYNAISGLVMATQLATDPLAAANAFSEVVQCASTVDTTVRDLVVATKRLLEEQGERERISLESEVMQFGQHVGTRIPARGDLQNLPPQSGNSMNRIAEEQDEKDAPSRRPRESDGLELQPRRAMSLNFLGNETTNSTSDSIPISLPEGGTLSGSLSRGSEVSMNNDSYKSDAEAPLSNPQRYGRLEYPRADGHSSDTLAGKPNTTMPTSADELARRSMPAKTMSRSVPMFTSESSPTDTPIASRKRNGSINAPKSPMTSEKLRRFIGESVNGPVSHIPSASPISISTSMSTSTTAVETPWFLGYDYAPEEILLNAEGQVKGATLECLVERLTLHDALDSMLIATFLMAYRSFTTSEEFLGLLIKRFNLSPPEGLTKGEFDVWMEKKQNIVRLRVFNIMKSWLENYYQEGDESDRKFLDRMKVFASTTLHDTMPFAATQLLKVIDKRLSSSDSGLRRMVLNLSVTAPTPILPKNRKKIKFTDIDPLELARQLTIIESKLFSLIQPVECLNKAWSDKETPKRAPNVKTMIETSNQLTGWVAGSILAEPEVKKRTALIKHFVGVADKCKSLNNFNALMAILAGLSSAPIHRLRRTWELVSNKSLTLLEILKKTMNPTRNFSEYRETLHSVHPPCVPFLGVYLTDLTFIEEGNPKHIRNASHLINFSKQNKTAEVIREIQQFQSPPYALTAVTELQEYLRRCLEESRDAQDLYLKSLEREPREREDEKMARLLAESGFL